MKFSIQSLYNWYRNLLRNPKYRWWVILGTIVYIISPIDFAPDFLPIIGEIDDTLLLTLLVTEVSGLVIEGFKARNQSNAASKADNNADNNADKNSEGSTSNPDTIDVDAVSVK